MAINLKDIPDAVKAYLTTKVTVTVENLTPVGTVINVGETFTFRVKVQNASEANGGVAFNEISYVIEAAPGTIAHVQVPSGGIATSASSGGTTLTSGQFVPLFFFSPTVGTDLRSLTPGETDTLTITGKALAKGPATISARIRGNVDEKALLGKGETTKSGVLNINVQE